MAFNSDFEVNFNPSFGHMVWRKILITTKCYFYFLFLFIFIQQYMYFILNISEVKNQSEFYTGLWPRSLPSEEGFLCCMAFNCVYDAGVACQSRSWFFFYTPRSKYHIGFSGERMTIYRRYKKIQRFSGIQYTFGDISVKRSKQ